MVVAPLGECGLPEAGLGAHPESILVARGGGGEAVCGAAFEPYGPDAPLGSVAVRAGSRGSGPGERPVREALAGERGVERAYLLTEGTDGYSERLGFRLVDRSLVPPEVQGSEEFVSACPRGARATTVRIRGVLRG